MLALLMFAVMSVSLVSCGNDAGSSSKGEALPVTPEDDFPYTTSFTDIDLDPGIRLHSLRFTAEGVYCLTDHISGRGETGLAYLSYDGQILVNTFEQAGNTLFRFDDQSGKTVKVSELPLHAYSLIPGGGDFDAYYVNGSHLCGVDLSTGKEKKILNWVNADINSAMYDNFFVTDDGTIYALLDESDYSTGDLSFKLFKGQKADPSQIRQKKILTFASQALLPDTARQITKFNRASSDVRIEVLDYSIYNTSADDTAGLMRLQTEILAGQSPDIIDLNSMPLDRLAARGLLEDLYPYIDADPEINREDFFPNLLKAAENSGKLYTTLPGFCISTLIGASRIVGDKPGWNYEEFCNALAGMPDDCQPMSASTTAYDILDICVSLDHDHYIDWETGKCNFESDDFISLLAFARLFPETYEPEEHKDDDREDKVDHLRMLTGRQMLLETSIYEFDNAAYAGMYFADQPYTCIGYPTYSGSGNFFELQSGFAISKNCTDKDAAWQFLRVFFMKDYQRKGSYLPSIRAVYDEMLQQAMTVHYRVDDSGEYVLDDNGEKIPVPTINISGGEMEYAFYALSQKNADQITELIETTDRIINVDKSVSRIIKEQAAAFFQGQKTAKDVAHLIQSKATIYVNEQK